MWFLYCFSVEIQDGKFTIVSTEGWNRTILAFLLQCYNLWRQSATCMPTSVGVGVVWRWNASCSKVVIAIVLLLLPSPLLLLSSASVPCLGFSFKGRLALETMEVQNLEDGTCMYCDCHCCHRLLVCHACDECYVWVVGLENVCVACFQEPVTWVLLYGGIILWRKMKYSVATCQPLVCTKQF